MTLFKYEYFLFGNKTSLSYTVVEEGRNKTKNMK
jgi:hypothetical protein